MAYTPLQNYLRTFRRRSGLSQKELAELLGAASGAKISRYENFSRVPCAATIFAYEVILGQPAEELFGGAYGAVRRSVQDRARRLSERLNRRPTNPRTARKLATLRAIVDSKPRAQRG